MATPETSGAGTRPAAEPEFRFGDGRLSGAVSVVLGSLSLLAVLCFRFPELLTTPELRAVYPMGAVRTTLFVALALGVAAGALSALLGRWGAGLVGMALGGTAIALGGAWVESRPVDASPHLGLDWFVLDLLLLALVFVPLERAFALARAQRILRAGWRTDLAHFFASHLLVQALALLSVAPAQLVFARLASPALQAAVAAQPILVQALECVVVADLFQYWIHRAFHALPWLWRFHAIHHSSTELDWLAGSRLHLVDVVATRAVTFVPLFVLGFTEAALVAYLVFVSFHAVLLHANLRFRFAALGRILATPEFHHWHHAVEPVDRNFAVHLPVLDAIFGTAWRPGGFPTRYGLAGRAVPDGWLEQLAWPFRRRAVDSASGDRASRKTDRRKRLIELASVPATLAFYESPRRIASTLNDCLETLGDRYAVIARELTKLHEEFLRGQLSVLAKQLSTATLKGEVVLLIDRDRKESTMVGERITLPMRVAELEAEGTEFKSALKQAAKEFGVGKSEAYRRVQAENK